MWESILRLGLMCLVGTFVISARASEPVAQLNAADPERVNQVIDGLVRKSRSQTGNKYFSKLFEKFCADVDYKTWASSSRDKINNPKNLRPEEMLVLSVIPHNEEFPGIDAKGYLSEQGIPVMTLVGATPDELEKILSILPKRKTQFKAVIITFSGHGLAIFNESQRQNAYHPERGLTLAIPKPDREQVNSALALIPELHQTYKGKMTKFADYLQAISNALPDGGDSVQITVDSCMAGAGMDDWLRLQRDNPTRATNFGIALTAYGNESERVEEVSTFETMLQEVLLHGHYLDGNSDGVIDGKEFLSLAAPRCRERNGSNAGVHIQPNPYFWLPVVKTGSETAIDAHQKLQRQEIYKKAVGFVQACRRCVGESCPTPHASAEPADLAREDGTALIH